MNHITARQRMTSNKIKKMWDSILADKRVALSQPDMFPRIMKNAAMACGGVMVLMGIFVFMFGQSSCAIGDNLQFSQHSANSFSPSVMCGVTDLLYGIYLFFIATSLHASLEDNINHGVSLEVLYA